METLDWHFDMFYLRRRINVASGTGTVWLPTLKQNLQGTYPRINQHVMFNQDATWIKHILVKGATHLIYICTKQHVIEDWLQDIG